MHIMCIVLVPEIRLEYGGDFKIKTPKEELWTQQQFHNYAFPYSYADRKQAHD